MTETTQLKLASVAFACLWTTFMWWWNRPLDTAQIVILAMCGLIAGISWYFGYGRWFRWHFGRNNSARG